MGPSEAYGRAVTLDADDPDFHFNMGVVEAELNNVELSINAYDQVLELDEGYPGVHNNQGSNYFRLQVYSRAVTLFTEATVLWSEDPVPHNNLCVAHLALKDYDAALAACDRAVSIDPDYRDGYYNRIQVMLRMGRFEGAAQAGKDLLPRIEPFRYTERAQVLASLSAAHYGLGQWKAAESAAKEAIKDAPELARAHYNLGRVYQHGDRNRKALAAYRQANALDDRDAETYMRL